MANAPELPVAADTGRLAFNTTHWSVVLAAGDDATSAAAVAALDELCRAYWFPLYAFVRRQGFNQHDAQDLTQEFLLRLMRRRDLARVGPEKGRFRSFLLAALKHFLINEWERARTLRRGGGQRLIELDAFDPEQRYCLEPLDLLTADRIYERKWALTVLERVLSRLKRELEDQGKGDHFERLKIFLSTDQPAESMASMARRLGLGEGAVKVAVHRLRVRYRELLRAEIARTVAAPSDVEDELRHLLQVLTT
jgi:RNA polymerase sigma-70 factor (ECF subfamily)